MADQGWRLRGEYMESCDCDYLCPCIYTNPQEAATGDHCHAMMTFRIDEGYCSESGGDEGGGDGVRLDGLCFALVIRSGRVMADGGWVFACVVDERADPAQRAALAAIASGERGGVTGMIRANLVSDFRGVEYAPIRFEMDGLKRESAIPGIFEFAIAGVGPRTNNGEPMYVDNTAHPANARLALARAAKLIVRGFGLDVALEGRGNNGHFAPFSWAG